MDEPIITSNSNGIGFCNKKGLNILKDIHINQLQIDCNPDDLKEIFKKKDALNHKGETKTINLIEHEQKILKAKVYKLY